MNYINNMKIGVRLNLILVMVMIIIVGGLGIYIYNIQKRNWLKAVKQQMIEQTKDIVGIVDSRVKSDLAEVSAIANLTKELYLTDNSFSIDRALKDNIKITNQLDQSSKDIMLPQMYFKAEKLYKNFKLVDLLSKQTSTSATIFQKIDDGFVRISTTLTKDNGERAINTYIPNSSPVAGTINKGETYIGRAFVVNRWFNAVYKPIKINGFVQGMLYSGIDEKKNISKIKEFISSKIFFNTGYPFIIDKNGMAVIHPKREGENLSNEEFFKKMKSNTDKSGLVEYVWEGKSCILFFEYYDPMEVYIAVKIEKDELLSSVYDIRNSILIAVFLGIILFVLANQIISKPITTALNKGVEFATQITSGNLDAHLEISNRNDEIGKMAKAQQEMVNKLKEIIDTVRTNASNVFSASQQLNSTAVELSQGANEQASSTEEVSASMEQMMANIEQNVANANVTEQIAVKAANDIERASNAVLTTVDAMKKIAEKISIIGLIAEKTDLLAINAAIEAARAGEHGLGFTVVASEIRKLAERSQDAAKQIDELTKTSVQIADKSGSELLGIVPDIKKTSMFVQEISLASLEQKVGADQINNALNQLNAVTQRTAAASEEMSASSEELHAQAELLKDAISFYKMEESDFLAKQTFDKKTINNNPDIKQSQNLINETSFITEDFKDEFEHF